MRCVCIRVREWVCEGDQYECVRVGVYKSVCVCEREGGQCVCVCVCVCEWVKSRQCD